MISIRYNVNYYGAENLVVAAVGDSSFCITDAYGFARIDHTEDSDDLFFEEPETTEVPADLFFTDEEREKLTEFEKAMIQFSHERNSLIQFEHTTSEINAHLYRSSQKLLDLARKELEKEGWRKPLRMYKKGYESGKQDALKDLPKWKKITKQEQNYLAYGFLSWDDYYLSIDELKQKLPKEE